MLHKHRQVLILLVGLVYVYSVCPFLCAAFEQKLCHDTSQKVLRGAAETGSTCCQRAEAGAAEEAETPSKSRNLCCLIELELVRPDDTHNRNNVCESVWQSLVSILPFSETVPITRQKSFKSSPEPLISTFFLNHSLSRRGPP